MYMAESRIEGGDQIILARPAMGTSLKSNESRISHKCITNESRMSHE